MWWDTEKREWTGNDISDFKKDMPPDHKRRPQQGRPRSAGRRQAFRHASRRARLALRQQRPERRPAARAFRAARIAGRAIRSIPSTRPIPPADKKERPDNPYAHSPHDPRFPFVLTTYRLTEHHTAGGMSRGLSHLAELQPELFAEISPELAQQLANRPERLGHDCHAARASFPRRRSSPHACARSRSMAQAIHQVGLPYHWGWKGIVTGDVVNDLLAISQEPNVRIMETKGLVCNLRAGPAPREGIGALEAAGRA